MLGLLNSLSSDIRPLWWTATLLENTEFGGWKRRNFPDGCGVGNAFPVIKKKKEAENHFLKSGRPEKKAEFHRKAEDWHTWRINKKSCSQHAHKHPSGELQFNSWLTTHFTDSTLETGSLSHGHRKALGKAAISPTLAKLYKSAAYLINTGWTRETSSQYLQTILSSLSD